jgi:hypothetical protein
MHVRLRRGMIFARRVDVDVNMFFAGVFVPVGMELIPEERPEPPQAEHDHRRADQPLAPALERLEVDDAPEPEREGRDDEDARRMAEPPPHPDDPRAPPGGERERRERGEMVGAGEDVKESGEESRAAGGQHAATA